MTPLLDVLRTLLEDAAAHGALSAGDAMVRTHLLWATLHGLDHFRKRDRIQPEALKTQALEIAAYRVTLRGWGAPESDLECALQLLPSLRAQASGDVAAGP